MEWHWSLCLYVRDFIIINSSKSHCTMWFRDRTAKKQSRDKNVSRSNPYRRDGLFDVSTWLRTHLFNHTLIKVSMWKCFVELTNIYNQLTLSTGNDPRYCGWVSLDQLKGLNCKTEASLRKKDFCLKTTASASAPEFAGCQPILQISDLPAPP